LEGLIFLSYFDPNISGDLDDSDINATINLKMDPLSDGSVIDYSIGIEDVVKDSNSDFIDNDGENSIMAMTATGTNSIDAKDGDDIIVIDSMTNGTTVDGGAGMDILVFVAVAVLMLII